MTAKSLLWRLIEQRHCDAIEPVEAHCDNLLRGFLRPWVIAVTLTRLEVA